MAMQSCYLRNKCSYLYSVSSTYFLKPLQLAIKATIKSCDQGKKAMSSGGASFSQGNSYEDAVDTLNKLQSSFSQIKNQSAAEKEKAKENSLPSMKLYLQRIGLAVEDLNDLNVIHISGTKGKGSAAAFTESILRSNGFKTGFFSSPHLIEVRERIRLNGEPLEKQKFAKYFFECYERLVNTASKEGDKMPGYFRFLTLMSFYVYLKEKVDVVVLEVGVGGSYDSTNIIRTPVVCGITLLEYDHIDVLGNTIESIACHKSGILKGGRPALSIPQIYKSAEKVLFQQAKKRKASSFQLVPELKEYGNICSKLGLPGKHQQINASLALQLCRLWMRDERDKYSDKIKKLPEDVHSLLDKPINEDAEYIDPFYVPETFKKGIQEAHWPGRCHIVRGEKETFYFDGAHTIGSMKAFVEWLDEQLAEDMQNFHMQRDDIYRILVFNLSRVDGGRDYVGILKELVKLNFDFAIFSTNIIEGDGDKRGADLTNRNFTKDASLEMCERNRKTWLQLTKRMDELDELNENTKNEVAFQKTASSAVFPSVNTCIDWIQNKDKSGIYLPPEKFLHASHVQVIVTGSFHLGGAVLKYLNCDIYKKEL